MSNFDNLMQGTRELSAEEKRKAEYAKQQAERRTRCYDMIEEACTKVIGTTEQMRKFLAVMSRFEAYSLNNNFLIYMQNPDAAKLKDRRAWEKDFPNNERFIRKGGKSLMILEPQKYKGDDGAEHIRYNPKLMFDISDIVDAVPDPKISYDMVQLIRALVDHCPIPIVTLKNGYPSDAPFGAYYDSEQQKIFARSGMAPKEIFQSVATAISHAEMDTAERKTSEKKQTTPIPYRMGDHEFQARCVAYVLCMRYGVPTDRVEINSVPPKYADIDSDSVRYNLSTIHECVKTIKRRMELCLNSPQNVQKRNGQSREER